MRDETPVYLILGATGGIGGAVSRQLATGNNHLVLGARTTGTLERLADELRAAAFPLDATRYEEVEAAVRFTTDTYGRLDGIVNCVGSILLKPAHLVSADEFEQTLSLNLKTAFYTVKAGARAMMKDGGSIVLCSSAAARIGLINHEAIAAAKAGVIGLTQSAAATYASRQIRVNCVAPGLVQTPMSARLTASEAGRKQSETLHALKRLGQPEDVSTAICWLLDRKQSSWITGQVFGIDGGLGTVLAR